MVAGHDRSGADHAPFANRDAGDNQDIAADPGVGADHDRPGHDDLVIGNQFLAPEIMARGVDLQPRPDNRAFADRHRALGIDPRIGADVNIVADVKPSFFKNAATALEVNVFPTAAELGFVRWGGLREEAAEEGAESGHEDQDVFFAGWLRAGPEMRIQ
jgi:hypothetical protein